MKDSTTVTVNKPIKWYNKEVKIDLKKLLIALTKSVLMFKFKPLTPVDGMKELTDMFNAFELKKDVSGLAYTLLLKAMVNAAHNLAKENIHLFNEEIQSLPELYDDPTYVQFLDEMNAILEAKEISISSETFKNPHSIPFLQDFVEFFQKWLVYFGIDDNSSKIISYRLPAYFVLALNDEWRSDPSNYELITKKTKTPFTEAAKRELEWERYNAFLQQQTEQPIFDEPFSLKQIFIPLRAYYYQKEGGSKDSISITAENERMNRIPVELNNELEKWLSTKEPRDCIRFLSGGPGSGKSSFAKIWAAYISEQRLFKVLFIPLHLLDLQGDMVDSIGKYVQLNADLKFSFNPLTGETNKLLIILDGLDELSQQGVVANEIAGRFITFVNNYNLYTNRENNIRTLFLITGRELSIQGNTNQFRIDKQILHLLPYKIEISFFEKLSTEQMRLIEIDQRNDWWIKYGLLKGKNFLKMPEGLNLKRLDEITEQPLLNYLVALSVERDKIKFTTQTNLNDIYRDLLEGVYERAYEKRQHKIIELLTLKDFCRILEEIAVSAWHGGDTRTTSVKQIERHIEKNNLKPLLERFKTDAKSGIIRLLTAFYFREFGIQDGEQTFEFTHKSFGEYLTAVRLVKQVERISKQLNIKKANYDDGWDEESALNVWLEMTGKTAMDDYLFSFVKDEVACYDNGTLVSFQKSCSQLLSYVINNGMPMLKERKSNKEENSITRNASETLLALHSALAIQTKSKSSLDINSRTAFGAWFSSLQLQRNGSKNVLAFNCLNYLHIRRACLDMIDFYRANISNSIFDGCELNYSILFLCNAHHTTFKKCKLEGASFQKANLDRTEFRECSMRNAVFKESNLINTLIKDSDLTGADFKGVIFEDISLEGTNLMTSIRLTGSKNREQILKYINFHNSGQLELDLFEEPIPIIPKKNE